MITIKDYAKESGVSYEAVRQRIKRYEKELEGHIHRQGRIQYLDDVAVAFLNEHRLLNPTVLYDRGAGEDFRALQQELQDAKAEAKDYWEQLKKKDNIIESLVEQNRNLQIKADSMARLEADNELARLKVAEAEQSAHEAQEKLTEAHEAFEIDLHKKDERIRAWERYAAEVEAYEQLSGFQKWLGRSKKPMPPVFEED